MRTLLAKHRYKCLCTSGTERKEADKYWSWSPSRDQTVHWQNPSVRLNNTAARIWACLSLTSLPGWKNRPLAQAPSSGRSPSGTPPSCAALRKEMRSFYLAVPLRTCLPTPKESAGTIWSQVPGFDCTSTLLFKFISNQKVTQREYAQTALRHQLTCLLPAYQNNLSTRVRMAKSPFTPTVLVNSGLHQLCVCA